MNGKLPKGSLAPITKAANGQQSYLRKDAARAFMAMNAESERRFGVTLRTPSARTAYRTYAEQQYFWDLYQSGQGNEAAEPGTSNHGWGLAVDLNTTQMRQIVDQIGKKYGFAKEWSDAPGEWWHIKWREGNYPAISKSLNPFYDFPKDEVKLLKLWDRSGAKKREELKPKLVERRKAIFKAASQTGWNKLNRRKRYHALLDRTR